MMSEMTKAGRFVPRTVALLLPPGGQLIGMIGFLEALDAANRLRQAKGRPRPYALTIAGVDAQTPSMVGATLRTVPASTLEAVHTIVVGGGLDMMDSVDPRFLAEVGRLADNAERIVSVCMGAFALGHLGWLDRRRCTTHWLGLDALRQAFPAAEVEPDAIHTEDDDVLTSAGATAGIDLALHLIRRDAGPRLALAVARALVVFAQRPGGQSQFGSTLRVRATAQDRLHKVVASVVEHPERDHGIEALAKRAGMSPRHFSRRFRDETGETPASFVARVRIEAAQRLLLGGDASLDEVAAGCGFGSVETLRRTFHRVAGVAPAAYRQRFRADAPRANQR